ncbi:MAG: hypothetical protein LUE64_04110, partial [Candidatus Gastranaerophilales bacterium]|nr:hypothetical protein [Candidatus Gastranaerophilales bacterium]
YNKRYKGLEELYKTGSKEDAAEEEKQILQDEQMHETLRQKITLGRDDELLDMAELKDKIGKRKSSLKFTMDKSGKLSSIRYQSRIIDENQSLSEERSFWI